MPSDERTLFDARVHPAALTAQDLETLQLFGVRRVLIVADATAHPPTPEGLFEHFETLLTKELPRLERAGLKTWAAIGVHPSALPSRGFHHVLDALPSYFRSGKVVALGQLGLSRANEAEREALLAQLELAERFQKPAVVSAPGRERERVTRVLVSTLREGALRPERILVDGAVGKTVRIIREFGFHAGLTLHPDHLTVERAVAVVRTLGPQRLILGSAAGDGASDILSLSRAAHRLTKAGLSQRVVQRVTFENASALFDV